MEKGYEHYFTEKDKQFVIDNQEYIFSQATANGIQLDGEDICYLVFLRTANNFKEFSEHWSNGYIYEISQLLLTILDSIQKKTTLKISSSRYSAELQKTQSLEFLRMNLDAEISLLHPTFVQQLGLPAKKETLYSIEQVDMIAEYLRMGINRSKLVSKDLSLPFVIQYIVSQFKARGVFNKDSKYLKTNEAVFIYDMLEFFDVMPKRLEDMTLSNQEKYQKIKEFLRTIEKRGKII